MGVSYLRHITSQTFSWCALGASNHEGVIEMASEKEKNEAEIDKLFHISRLPRLPWCLLLVFYIPFGVLLTFMRVCMSLQVLLLLTIFPAGTIKRFMLRLFFGILGIVVITDSFHRKGSQTKVYVSNRVSYLDHLVLHLALDCITVSSGGTTPFLSFFFPHRKLLSRTPEHLESEAKELPEFDDSLSTESITPFVIQPEPRPTNGSYALFQFSDWPCSLATNVQPIALTAKRPFGIKITTVYSSQWWDLLWTIFVPATVYRVKLLAPMELREDEETQELSERLQECLREELCLQSPSQVTLEDVETWIKASRQRSTPTPSSSKTKVSTRSDRELEGLDEMIQKVSAVLPQVPLDTIKKELLRTQNVDGTIANFLEGVVHYDPLPPPPPKPISRHSNATSPSSYTAGSNSSFKSSDIRPRKYYGPVMEAMHRQMSLEERKRELIEGARQRYIEKHGLSQSQ